MMLATLWSHRRPVTSKTVRHARLQVECLEERTLPTTALCLMATQLAGAVTQSLIQSAGDAVNDASNDVSNTPTPDAPALEGAAPPPSVSISDATVTEGNSGLVEAAFNVILSVASQLAVLVDYATANGDAGSPDDFVPSSGTLTFAPGETSKVLTVLVNGDLLDEIDEKFFINLGNVTNATLADDQAVGTILDDDGEPSPSALGDSGSTAPAPSRSGEDPASAPGALPPSDGGEAPLSDDSAESALADAGQEGDETIDGLNDSLDSFAENLLEDPLQKDLT